jgi:hypothetical protein
MNFVMSIFDRVLSSMTGRTCENVVGAEARHIHQDVRPGLVQVDESDIHRQTIGNAHNRVEPSGYVFTCFYECYFIITSYEANTRNQTVV